jgi:GNAT superfamily N-acetyltransferase
MVQIRLADADDIGAIWSIIEPAIRAGETLALHRDISKADNIVFVAEHDGQIAGSYFLRANQSGGGGHVCNAGYATAPTYSGRGVARRMCEHSLETAKSRGFCAMQFNFVVSTNERAVGLWLSCGFNIVGRLPQAFLHPMHGYVDALIMHRNL